MSQYPQKNAEKEDTLHAENVKILHRLQFLLVRVSDLLVDSNQISHLHQVFICGMTVFPQLCQFWDSLRRDIARDNPYIANIGGMRLCFSELQENDEEAKLLRGAASLPEGWEDVKGVLQYQGLPYVPEIICSEMINCYHNGSLVGYFGIDKTRELVGRKYYWPGLRRDVESYIRGCDICLASKAVRHKPYGDLQFLPIPTHRWKNLSMDFVTRLPLSADWKSNSYNFILVIVNQLTKMVH